MEAAIKDERCTKILNQRIAGDSLTDIAVHLGLTKERVRQLQNKALEAIEDVEARTVTRAYIYRSKAKPRPNAGHAAIKKALLEYFKNGGELDYHKALDAAEKITGKQIARTSNPWRSIPEALWEEFRVGWCGSVIRCGLCKNFLPSSDFTPAIRKDPYNPGRHCHKCNAARLKKYLATSEKARKYYAQYAAEHPEVMRRAGLKYYYKNKDRINARSREKRAEARKQKEKNGSD